MGGCDILRRGEQTGQYVTSCLISHSIWKMTDRHQRDALFQLDEIHTSLTLMFLTSRIEDFPMNLF